MTAINAGLVWGSLPMAANEIEREMRAYYQARAAIYDRIYANHQTKDYMQAFGDYLRELLAGRKVLEVACGTGFWTGQVAPHVQCMLATDGMEGPLDQARKNLAALGNVTLLQTDAYTLEGVTGDFDGAMHIQWYSHIPMQRIGAFLDTLHTRLRPGARVVMADTYMGEADSRERKEQWESVYTFDTEGNAYTQRKLPDGRHYRVYKNMPLEADLRKQLNGCVRDFEYRTFTEFWAVTYLTSNG